MLFSTRPLSSTQPARDSGIITINYYPEAMHWAQQLLYEDAMGPTDDLLSQGQMTNLNVHSVEGINYSIHCSVGRFGEEGVMHLFGKKTLPIISSSTKLVELIL